MVSYETPFFDGVACSLVEVYLLIVLREFGIMRAKLLRDTLLSAIYTTTVFFIPKPSLLFTHSYLESDLAQLH